MDKDKNEDKNLERDLKGYLRLGLAALLIIAGPAVLHALVPANVLGWTVVAYLVAVVIMISVWDTMLYRENSASMPIAIAVSWIIARGLYFNEGTWIYLPILVGLGLGAQLLVKKARA